MRAVWGLASLLVVLAVVGWLATRQLKAVNAVHPESASASGALQGGVGSGNARVDAQRIQQRLRDDTVRALEQGTAASRAEVDER